MNSAQHIDFGNTPEVIGQIMSEPVRIALDDLGVIRATGSDAQTFLQGQLSNDIRELSQPRLQMSAYCNPKGRMLAQFLIFPDGVDYLLVLPRVMLAPTLQRLKMFIMRSQVSLDDVSDQRICLGLVNVQLDAVPGVRLPGAEYALAVGDELLAGKLPGPVNRYLLVCSAQAAQTTWNALDTHSTPAGAGVWHWLDIQAGLPSVWPQTREEFVPQMLNLELLQGVNFKKGCYPGQEIVARMHYLGKPKRRMYRLQLAAQHPAPPGTDIYVAGGDGQSAGKIVLAQPGPQGTDLLAVLQTDKADAALHLGSPDGPQLTRAELPYSLDSTGT